MADDRLELARQVARAGSPQMARRIIVAWQAAHAPPPAPPQTGNERLTAAVQQLVEPKPTPTPERNPMSITGTSNVIMGARDLVAKARERVSSAHARLGKAVETVTTAAGQYEGVAVAMEAEAKDLNKLTSDLMAQTNQPATKVGTT